MNRYTKACPGLLRNSILQNSRSTLDGQKRWVSYDKSELSRNALLNQIESELGRMAHGKRARIDADKKTVDTDAGPLPISPLMDYEFMQGRRRTKKGEPGYISGQFRRKLSNNPYAAALMTELRWCKNTNAGLPRHFLQDFELVNHPDPKETNLWWAPGIKSFQNVKPWKIPTARDIENDIDFVRKNIESIEKQITTMASGASIPAEVDTSTADTPTEDKTAPVADVSSETQAYTEEGENDTAEESEEAGITEINTTERREMRQARFVTYTLARKSLIDMVGNNKSYQAKMAALRSGMAVSQTSGLGRQKVFRPDMGDVLLTMLRRMAVDALVARSSKRAGRTQFKFIMPIFNWEEAKTVVEGGCVLYIPKEDMDDMNSYATLDVENATYGRKMAVHDLRYLLGEEELERLMKSSWPFRNQELLVLKNFRSESMRSLHLLLWRLQGYLAEPQVELTEPRQY